MKKFFDRAISLIKSHKIIFISAVIAIVAGVVLCFVLANTNWGNPEEPNPTEPDTTSHNHIYVEEEVEATCGHGGRTLYICECGHSYVENETPALEHEYGDWVLTLEATVESEGQKERYCLHCNHRITELIPKIEEHKHAYVSQVVASTCTKTGYTLYTCEQCGDSYSGSVTNPLCHSFNSWQTTKEPTTSVSGEKTRMCTRCGYTEKEAIPKLSAPAHEHNYVETVTAPTCTEAGYSTYTCSSCGHSYTGNETQPRDHLYLPWTITIPATTSAPGERETNCERCGHVLTEVIPQKEEKHENIDPSLTIYTVSNGATVYENKYCCVVDTRTWGSPPAISVYDEYSLQVVYYQQNGNAVTVNLDAIVKEYYTVTCIIAEDGTHSVHIDYTNFQ